MGIDEQTLEKRAYIRDHRPADLSIRRGRKLMDLPRSSFYAAHDPTAEDPIIGVNRSITETCRNYGYRRVTAEFRHRGLVVDSKKVRRIMPPMHFRGIYGGAKFIARRKRLINNKFYIRLVRVKGLEPPRLAAPEPKSGASTSSATPALGRASKWPAAPAPPSAARASMREGKSHCI